MAIPFPIINGVVHDFSSIEVVGPAGRMSVAMKSLDYERTRDRDFPHGAHQDPLGKTQGTNTYKASCELYLVQWQLLKVSLGPGYGDTPFPIFVTYNAAGMPPIADELFGCTIDSTKLAHAAGKNALTAKIDLGPIKILFDGEDDVLFPLVAQAF
jgi:hypothetical protein